MGAIAAPLRPLRGNRIIPFGDSITIANSDMSKPLLGDRDYMAYAQARSGGKLAIVRNAGVSGDTTAQMLARLDADVIAYRPDICSVLAGTNDIGAGTPLATTKANLDAIYSRLRAAGTLPVCNKPTPRTTSDDNALIGQLGQWISRYANDHGYPCVDMFSAMVDPATGGIQAALTTDGLHPSIAGAQTMGQVFADSLVPSLRSIPFYLSGSKLDYNLFTSNVERGVFTTDTNADGLSNGWFEYGGSGRTYTRPVVAGVLGRFQGMEKTDSAGSAGNQYVALTSTGTISGWSVGDRIAFCGKFSTAGIVAGAAAVSIKLTFTGSSGPSYMAPVYTWASDNPGVNYFYLEATIPAGTTALTPEFNVTAGLGTLSIGQVTIINLTTQGF